MTETRELTPPVVELARGNEEFRNTGSGMLKLFATYSPPEREPGTEHATRAKADADE